MLEFCSDFIAGNSFCSSQRYHTLDETAVFGSAEIPFIKHGERYDQVSHVGFWNCVLVSDKQEWEGI